MIEVLPPFIFKFLRAISASLSFSFELKLFLFTLHRKCLILMHLSFLRLSLSLIVLKASLQAGYDRGRVLLVIDCAGCTLGLLKKYIANASPVRISTYYIGLGRA